MSPELHLKKEYSGVANDLFAFGIIVFVMYSGMMPFEKATAKD